MKYKYLFINGCFLLVFLCFSFHVPAQEQVSVRDKANDFFEKLQFAKAGEIYLKLTDTSKPRYMDMKRLAVCYMKMDRYEDAEIWFSRVVADPSSIPEDLYDYAEMMKTNANYLEAKEVFRDYMEKTGDEKRALLNIAGCDSAEVWMSNPTRHFIRNEDKINTNLSEFSVFPFGEKSICFIGEPQPLELNKTYGWTGKPFLRIFAAEKQSDNSLDFRELSKSMYNDAPYHVGPISTNREGNMYFITRTYPGKNGSMTVINGNRYHTQNMELYIQTKKYDQWLTPQPFPYNNVKEYSLGQAVLSKDEKVLYFVSDMPGGYGGTDIWYSELQPSGKWSKCKNAGSTVNTSGDEMFPTFGPDGILYFSSNGFPGMGGLDIFSCKGSLDNWSTSVNLRYPLNSSYDDFSYILNDNMISGYLSSNRVNGKGGDDIYSFINKEGRNLITIEGLVYNKKTGKRLSGANVFIYNSSNTIVAKQISDAGGAFLFQLHAAGLSKLKATKDSYYPDTMRLSNGVLLNDRSRKLALYLDPLEKGKTYRLQNIHYNFDKDNIREDASAILNGLVRIMHDNPTLKIELASHTDNRGNDKYNMALSQRRAQSVVDYLVNRGISRDRMVAKGYGESHLLYKSANGIIITEAEHQQNRRTEFTIISY
jgi:outer membrane protein OmpA-like peptidoglycan-associated protein/tetratricopeptide (TPR) repeat protein